MSKSAEIFLSQTLYLPIVLENEGASSVQSFETSDGRLILAFSSELALARFFGESQDFIALNPLEVCEIALKQNSLIGFDMEEAHGEIFITPAIQHFEDFLKNQNLIARLNIQICHKPEGIEELITALSQQLGKAQRDYEMRLVATDENTLVLAILHQDGMNPALLFEKIWPVLSRSKPYKEVSFLPLDVQKPAHQKLWKMVDENGIKLTYEPQNTPVKPPILRY